jgi:hypothetical protein
MIRHVCPECGSYIECVESPQFSIQSAGCCGRMMEPEPPEIPDFLPEDIE